MHGDGMTPVDVAWVPDPVTQNVSTMLLDHNSDNFKDHILSGTLFFGGMGVLNADHEGTTWVRVDVTFELNGKVI